MAMYWECGAEGVVVVGGGGGRLLTGAGQRGKQIVSVLLPKVTY